MPLFNEPAVPTKVVATHPGFISGKYYGSSFFSSYSSLLLNQGIVYYTYFFIPFNQTFSSISFVPNAVNSATQKARIAIYTIDNGLPSTLVKDFGEIALSTAAIKEVLSSISLTAGWYAVALVTNESSASVLCPSHTMPNLIGFSTVNSGSFNGFRSGMPYQAFPAIAPTANILNTQSPVIWLKAA